jgi:hypothetical protein
VRFCFLSLALVVALVGCGGSAFVDTHASPEARQAATSIVSYRAFGDSITFGLTLADPGTQSYPPLVAAQMNVADFANYGIPTEEACDIANMEIAAHQVSPTLTMRPFYSVLVGANDLRQDNVVEHEATYAACLQAILSWLAVPREYKVNRRGRHPSCRWLENLVDAFPGCFGELYHHHHKAGPDLCLAQT